jgi:hypothetical protein
MARRSRRRPVAAVSGACWESHALQPEKRHDPRLTDMRPDITDWDVTVVRKWPYGMISGWPYTEVVPPVEVRISANFMTDASALEFERQVRKLLSG